MPFPLLFGSGFIDNSNTGYHSKYTYELNTVKDTRIVPYSDPNCISQNLISNLKLDLLKYNFLEKNNSSGVQLEKNKKTL